jgi:hypothetical protein
MRSKQEYLKARVASMENEAKANAISRWVDPQERVTVDFEDQKDLNAEVTRCNTNIVTLALETSVPHVRQELSIPLGKVEVGEDQGKYTRDPDRPLHYGRLRLSIAQKRPQSV